MPCPGFFPVGRSIRFFLLIFCPSKRSFKRCGARRVALARRKREPGQDLSGAAISVVLLCEGHSSSTPGQPRDVAGPGNDLKRSRKDGAGRSLDSMNPQASAADVGPQDQTSARLRGASTSEYSSVWVRRLTTSFLPKSCFCQRSVKPRRERSDGREIACFFRRLDFLPRWGCSFLRGNRRRGMRARQEFTTEETGTMASSTTASSSS